MATNRKPKQWWLLYGGYDMRPEQMAAIAKSVGCTANTTLDDGERTLTLYHSPKCPSDVIASFYGVYSHCQITGEGLESYRGDPVRPWVGYSPSGDTWAIHPLSDC